MKIGVHDFVSFDSVEHQSSITQTTKPSQDDGTHPYV